MNAVQTFILRSEFFRSAVADAVRELPQAPEAADWQRMTSAIVKAWKTSTPLENVRDVRATIVGDASGTAVSAVVDALEKLPGCAATGGETFDRANAELRRAIAHLRTFPVTTSKDAATSPTGATLPAAPAALLTSWREITDALELEPSDYEKLKRLNEQFDGPIPKPRKGSQPLVQKGRLIDWWNKLEAMQKERDNDAESKRLSGESHAYGRDGEVVPELAGSVKRRRRDAKR